MHTHNVLQGMEFFKQFVEEDPEVAAVMAEAVDHANGTAAATCMLADSLLKARLYVISLSLSFLPPLLLVPSLPRALSSSSG